MTFFSSREGSPGGGRTCLSHILITKFSGIVVFHDYYSKKAVAATPFCGFQWDVWVCPFNDELN